MEKYNNKNHQALLSLITSVLHSATLYTMVQLQDFDHKSSKHATCELTEFLQSMRSENDKKTNVSIQTPA